MAFGPSWLSSNKEAAPEAPPAPAPTAREIQEMKDLPGVIQFMRLLNLGAAGGLIAAGIWCMVTLPGPARFVLSIYAVCGACVICCLETNLKFLRVMIAVNFGFLFSPLFRFMYYMLMAGVSLTLDRLLAYIVAGVFVGVAFYNTYVLFRYPAYKKLRDSIAEDEDKRIDAAITKRVRKEAVKQMFK